MSTLKNEYRHIPVLLEEILQVAKNFEGGIFADCTLGGAGHSKEIAKILGSQGMLIGIDQDTEAIAAADCNLNKIDSSIRPEIRLVNNNFGNFDEIMLEQEIPGLDLILMDLGMSSHQIDDISRGFAFKVDSPLDMRMDPTKQTLTAAKIVNFYSMGDLIRVLRDSGEEKWAPQIARGIIKAREISEIKTSFELVDIIKDSIPAAARRKGGHPAKRTFQALRIEVNEELKVLKRGLDSAIRWLNPGGKIMVITYHSLEDRIVKETFNSLTDRCICPPDLPTCMCGLKPILKIETKKPILPTDEEVKINSRSRSAKLRIAKKVG